MIGCANCYHLPKLRSRCLCDCHAVLCRCGCGKPAAQHATAFCHTAQHRGWCLRLAALGVLTTRHRHCGRA